MQPLDPAEVAHYPPDIQSLILEIDSEHVARFKFFVTTKFERQVSETGHVSWRTPDGMTYTSGSLPIHGFFSLSYASWLVLPRLALQEMPPDWQARFVALMEEGYERGLAGVDGLQVQRRVGGRFVSNQHWNDYRRGTVAGALNIDKENGHDG